MAGFASVLTMGQDTMAKRWKHLKNEKGRKNLWLATVGRPMYMPIKVTSSRDAHLQVMVVGLEATNAILPSSFCTNLMLPLAGTLAIF